MNGVRTIRGIFNTQACNPILVVPPNAFLAITIFAICCTFIALTDLPFSDREDCC